MSLKQRITTDMTAAMKSKDASRLSTLRMVKAAVQNREIEKGGELTDEELTKALQSLLKQRRDAVEQYEQAGGGGVGGEGGGGKGRTQGEPAPGPLRGGEGGGGAGGGGRR